jgi:hypothetical protein
MRWSRPAISALGIAALALGLAACGGGPSVTTSTSTSSTTSSTSSTTLPATTGTGSTGGTGATGTTGSSTTTTAPLPASQAMAAARAALLTRADLPASWTSTPSSSNSGTGLKHSEQVQLAQCLGVPLSDISYNPPEVNSPEFAGPGGLPSVNDGIQVFPSAAVAKLQFDTLMSPQTPHCLTQVFVSDEAQLEASFPSGSKVTGVSVTTVPFAPLADRSIALLLRFTVAAGGQTYKVAGTLIAVLDGRFGITLEGTNLTQPMSSTYLHELAALNVSRLG